jgi:hypothetical protein
MTVLPAHSAPRFWARIGESLAQCQVRHEEVCREIQDSAGSPPIAGPAPANAASNRVLITANFDAEKFCVEISYAKEDGSRFAAEEIAAFLASNSADGQRKWTQMAGSQWRSDDGFTAQLGATKFSAKRFYCWLHFTFAPSREGLRPLGPLVPAATVSSGKRTRKFL